MPIIRQNVQTYQKREEEEGKRKKKKRVCFKVPKLLKKIAT